MSSSTTNRKSALRVSESAVPLSPLRASVNHLAQQLAKLNRQIEPDAVVLDEYEAARVLHAALKPSLVRISQAVVLQHQGLTLIVLSLDAPVPIELLKLSDMERKFPLLLSFGTHTPGQIQSVGQHLFAFTMGIKLHLGQMVQIDAVSSGGRISKAIVGVSALCEETLVGLLPTVQSGQRLLERLPDLNQAQARELRSVLLAVDEFSRRYETPYAGSVDVVQRDLIEGWLWCPWKPDRRYEIQAWSNDRLVGYAKADQLRDDLARKKKSDGRLKFSIRVSHCLNDSKVHWVQLRVIGQGELDRSIDFDKPIRYRVAKSSFDKPQDGLMGYDLDQKVAKALSLKIDDLARQTIFLEVAPKISLHLEFGESSRARELLREVIGQVGADGFLTLKLAETYLLDGDTERALKLFSQVVRKAKRFIWGHLGLAYVLLKIGHEQDALKALENAHALSPYYPGLKQSIQTLSSKMLQLGKLEEDPRRLAERIVAARIALIQEPENLERSAELLSLLAQRRPQLMGASLEPPIGLTETANLRHARALLEAFSGSMRRK